MKKITILTLSLLISISLMAQLKMSGPPTHYNNNGSRDVSVYSQMDALGVVGYASQEFPDYSDSRLQSADDFVVPAGGWNFDRVEVIGSGSADASSTFIIEIYSDNSGLPGTLIQSQTGLSFTETSGLFSIPLSSTISLPAGTYWISVMIDQNFAAYGQWYWSIHNSPQIGYEFANQDPNQLLGGTWPASWDSGSNTIGGLSSYDFCFALYSNNSSVPLSNWALAFGVLLILGFIVVRYKTKMA